MTGAGSSGHGAGPAADAGPALDGRARAQYRGRLATLRAQLEEAERFDDALKAAELREEIHFIAAEVARSVGLGGRDRPAASVAERARVNVRRAIQATLKRIAAGDPELGRYLETTIRTGTFCRYAPDPRFSVTWQLG
jgi:non-specific serine/threonine protein kinase